MAKNSTRESLLQRGFDLFHTNGYHATGIQEITDTVGVSKGSFYNHFKKKEKFAAEMIDNFGKQLASEHKEALSNPKQKPLERIIKFYKAKTTAVIHIEHFRKGCFISNMCQEIADQSELIAKSIDLAFNGMTQALADCLEEAKNEGSISPETNTEYLAEFILNSWEWRLDACQSIP